MSGADGHGYGRREPTLIEAAPRLMRFGIGAYWRTARWAVESTMDAGNRVVRAAVRGESPAELVADVGRDLRRQAWTLLGVDELEDRVRGAVRGFTGEFLAVDPDEAAEAPAGTNGSAPATGPAAGAPRTTVNGSRSTRESEPTPERLRARGSELLARSTDVHYEESAHPAYARILDELAPDEARILRFLALEGAQPAIDVRTARPLDIGSQLVAPGLNMIGAQAGCRYVDRVPSYLNNLYRLGLIWFSREPMPDHMRYQVLEAQPEVVEALRKAGRGKTVRRSIALTPFGEDFCRVCLPLPAPPRAQPIHEID